MNKITRRKATKFIGRAGGIGRLPDAETQQEMVELVSSF